MKAVFALALILVCADAMASECRVSEGYPAPLRTLPLGRRSADTYAFFHLPVRCDADAKGLWSLEFNSSVGREKRVRKPVNRKHEEQKLPPSRRPFDFFISDRAMLCRDLPVPKSPKNFVLTGSPGARVAGFPVEVEVRIRGEGAMAPVRGNYKASAWCPACLHLRSRGSIYVRIPAGKRIAREAPHLETRLPAEWLNCVRSTSTLELRLFGGTTRQEALDAVRPTTIIEGLEKKLNAGSKGQELPLPKKAICRVAKPWVAYELTGKGELSRAGGGGRGAVEIDCR